MRNGQRGSFGSFADTPHPPRARLGRKGREGGAEPAVDGHEDRDPNDGESDAASAGDHPSRGP